MIRGYRIDQSEDMLEELKLKFHQGKIDSRIGEAENLPVGDNLVDYVFANMYLHHVESPLKAMREMIRILRIGGKVVVTDLDEHCHNFLKMEYHDRWMGLKREGVKGYLLEAGAKNVFVDYSGENCRACSNCCSESASVSIFIAYREK